MFAQLEQLDCEGDGLKSALKQHLVGGFHDQSTDGMRTQPLRLKNAISSWGCTKWTPEMLAANYAKDKIVRPRFGLKKRAHEKSAYWEGECEYEEGSFQDFIDWLIRNRSSKTDTIKTFQNPFLKKFDRNNYFGYLDYKYFVNMFSGSELENIRKDVNWGIFGIDQNVEESTLWVGSEGAQTVGHYDTYGWNLVAQLYGRKRWLLAKEDLTEILEPTRFPYEESSVFSRLSHESARNKLAECDTQGMVYEITLEPGDVLYVPRHWWHFVACEENSISINMWVHSPLDDGERKKECIVRSLVSLYDHPNQVLNKKSQATDGEESRDQTSREWLNPTEEHVSICESLDLLQKYTLGEIAEADVDYRVLVLESLFAAITHPSVVDNIEYFFQLELVNRLVNNK